MATGIAGKALLQNTVGLRVSRATGALPASTNAALFTVSTGRILLTSIVGTVTTVIQSQACNLNLTANSTAGNITTNLCAVLDINALAVGNLLSITGVRADALLSGATGYTNNELVIQPGTIRWVTSATNTGSISWTLTYIPLDDGAFVTAA